jgi:hypothetical protein
MFDTWQMLLYGLVTGFVFGFVLQKGQLAKFSVIVEQFLLRDFTVLKTMLTAIVVGGIGVYALRDAGLATLHIKPALLVANIGGGLIFGAGMALLGYCPGTALAAVAEKSRHAIVGILGMIFGAAALAETYPYFAAAARAVDYKDLTLAGLTGLSPWILLAGLALVSLVLFITIERWERRRTVPAAKPPAASPAEKPAVLETSAPR